MIMDVADKSLNDLKSVLGKDAGEVKPALDDIPTLEIEPMAVVKALRFLRDHKEGDFDLLTDLTAVDWLDYPESGERFEIVYLLCSTGKNHRARLKTRIPDLDPRIESATSVYRTANWLEREVYDMFGIKFDGHPDLRRILMWEGFEGYPLRKDFPTRGYGPVERTPET